MYPIKERTKFWYERSRAFLKEVWIETNPKTGKVSWPGKKAIIGSTIAVLISVIIFGLYLALTDYISFTIMMFLVR